MRHTVSWNTNSAQPVTLTCMIVAGDHARNDLSGDGPDSWKSQLEALGFETQTILTGLGEIPEIAKKFAAHIHEV